MNPTQVASAVLGGLGVLIALVVLFWPGPLALDDRLPMALVFGVPGVIFAYRGVREARAG